LIHTVSLTSGIQLITAVEEETPLLPSGYALRQNYPNPFNPVTTINYSLPVRGHVNITIYNILGREVATLVDDIRPSGNHRVEWNGADKAGHQVASGIYLYRMSAGEFVQTRKMVLIR